MSVVSEERYLKFVKSDSIDDIELTANTETEEQILRRADNLRENLYTYVAGLNGKKDPTLDDLRDAFAKSKIPISKVFELQRIGRSKIDGLSGEFLILSRIMSSELIKDLLQYNPQY